MSEQYRALTPSTAERKERAALQQQLVVTALIEIGKPATTKDLSRQLAGRMVTSRIGTALSHLRQKRIVETVKRQRQWSTEPLLYSLVKNDD